MSDEIKGVIDSLGRQFEEFKSANDQAMKELKEKGHVDPVLQEKVDKLSDAMTAMEEKKASIEALKGDVDKLAKQVARTPKGEQGEDLDAKAMEWARMVAKNTDRSAPESFTAKELSAYREAFVKMMRKGDQFAHSLDGQKALSVGSDPDGGYTVLPDTSGRIVQKVFETSAMRQYASVQTIGTDALEGSYDLDEAGAGWVGETGARAETTTPQLGKWRIPVHELYAFPYATQKLLDDSNVNIEAWLEMKVADRFARIENAAFVNGDGNGKPRGFLTYADGTTLPGTIERINSGADGAFVAAPNGGDVLLTTIDSMKGAYLPGCRWFMNRSTVSAVRKLKNSDGDYLWQPGLQSGVPGSLLGYEVARFEDMPNLATGSLSIAFGDMSRAYQIVDRAGIRVLRDPFTNKPYVGFYTTKRTGGDVVNFEALKLIEFSAS